MDKDEGKVADFLREEEEHLIREMGEEPDYLTQVSSIFRGATGWPSMVMMVTQLAMFVAGVWAAVHFFRADSVLEALRWGLPSAILLLGSLIVKLSMWPQLHANRVIRELKRLEWRLEGREG